MYSDRRPRRYRAKAAGGRPSTRNSYSIAIFDDEGKILVRGNRHTYEFCEIVRSTTQPGQSYVEIFTALTAEERQLLIEHDFDVLFNRVFYGTSGVIDKNVKIEMKERFYALWPTSDSIIRVMNQAGNPGKCVETLPGGRKETTDGSSQATAIRETLEETGLSPNDYTIIEDVTPLRIKHDDGDHRHYCNTVWLARLNSDCDGSKARIDYSTNQAKEVSSVAWKTYDEIASGVPENRDYIRSQFLELFNTYRLFSGQEKIPPVRKQTRTHKRYNTVHSNSTYSPMWRRGSDESSDSSG